MQSVRPMLNAILWMVITLSACADRRYVGLLSQQANDMRNAGGEWECAATTINPTQFGAQPFELCSGLVADTAVAILSDGGGLVLEVTRGWSAPDDPVVAFSMLNAANDARLGSSVMWCDTVGLLRARLWQGDTTYTVLALHAVGKLSVHRGLGVSYCSRSANGTDAR